MQAADGHSPSMMTSALKAQWAGMWDDGTTIEMVQQDLWLAAQK